MIKCHSSKTPKEVKELAIKILKAKNGDLCSSQKLCIEPFIMLKKMINWLVSCTLLHEPSEAGAVTVYS